MLMLGITPLLLTHQTSAYTRTNLRAGTPIPVSSSKHDVDVRKSLLGGGTVAQWLREKRFGECKLGARDQVRGSRVREWGSGGRACERSSEARMEPTAAARASERRAWITLSTPHRHSALRRTLTSASACASRTSVPLFLSPSVPVPLSVPVPPSSLAVLSKA